MHVRTLGIVMAALLLVPSLLLSQPQAPAALPSGTSAIMGVVVDAQSGAPIAHALVTLFESQRRARGETTSAEDGTFAFANLGDGAFRLTAKAAGYSAAAYGATRPFEPGQTITLATGQAARSIEVRLQRGGVIKGRVVNESGEPLPGAVVMAGTTSPRSPTNFIGAVAPVRSDDRGAYELRDIPPGEWIVSAQGVDLRMHDGVIRRDEMVEYKRTFFPGVVETKAAQVLTLSAGDTIDNVTFSLQREPFYTLRIPVDLTGLDRSTVEIVLLGAKGFTSHKLAPEAIGPDGDLVVRRVKPGNYLLWIRGRATNGVQAGTREISIDDDTLEPPVTLSPASVLVGRVVADSSETEAPSGLRVLAPIFLTSGDSPPFPVDSTDVTSDGTFTLRGLFGDRRLRVDGLPAPWKVRRVIVGGQEVPPTAVIGFRTGQTLDATFVVGREP